MLYIAAHGCSNTVFHIVETLVEETFGGEFGNSLQICQKFYPQLIVASENI